MATQQQRRRQHQPQQRRRRLSAPPSLLALLLAATALLLLAGAGGAEALSLGGVKAGAKAALHPLIARARAALEAAEAATAPEPAAAAASKPAVVSGSAPAQARQQPGAPHIAAADGDEARAAFDSITGGGGASADAYLDADADDAPARPGRVRLLSWEPRAFLWEGFMDEEEADHLVALGRDHLIKSDVVDSDTGDIVSSKERTSSGYFLPRRGLDAVVARLEARIARWAQVPVGHGEPFHLLRYNPAEEYTAHFDYFFDKVHVQNGGQRVATAILYLSEVEEGGETVFPDAPTRLVAGDEGGGSNGAPLSACAQRGLAVRPRKGDALLFFGLKPDGVTTDVKSLHAGCPVVRGTKWIATKWIRVRHYHDWGSEGPQDGAPEAEAAGGGEQQQQQPQQEPGAGQRDEL